MELDDRLKAALFDRYRIEWKIGEGGMATVYLAYDHKHDRQVALKVFRPELAAVIGAERFLNEIRVTANLHHPHILPLFDSGQAGGFLFYVMPLVDGESLRTRLDREGQLPFGDAIRITSQVADAIGFAHRQKIVHRDIKPGNILLYEGHALLADFGIALAASAAGGHRLTGSGFSLGTPGYMSPEQASGKRDLDARSDIFSLGSVLYEMVTGEPPFTGRTPRTIISKLLNEQPTLPHIVRDTVPVGLERVIMTALAKAPPDRFQSAEEFGLELDREVHEEDRSGRNLRGFELGNGKSTGGLPHRVKDDPPPRLARLGTTVRAEVTPETEHRSPRGLDRFWGLVTFLVSSVVLVFTLVTLGPFWDGSPTPDLSETTNEHEVATSSDSMAMETAEFPDTATSALNSAAEATESPPFVQPVVPPPEPEVTGSESAVELLIPSTKADTISERMSSDSVLEGAPPDSAMELQDSFEAPLPFPAEKLDRLGPSVHFSIEKGIRGLFLESERRDSLGRSEARIRWDCEADRITVTLSFPVDSVAILAAHRFVYTSFDEVQVPVRYWEESEERKYEVRPLLTEEFSASAIRSAVIRLRMVRTPPDGSRSISTSFDTQGLKEGFSLAGCGVNPKRWTPDLYGERSPQWDLTDRHTHLSSAGRSSSLFGPAVRRKS